jgi:hypothetical protein
LTTIVGLTYHDAFGRFPAAYIAGKNGRPMHSWRVLTRPFLGRQDVYDQYHFDEPWDDLNNRRLEELRALLTIAGGKAK